MYSQETAYVSLFNEFYIFDILLFDYFHLHSFFFFKE